VFENYHKKTVKPEAMRLLSNGNPLFKNNFMPTGYAEDDGEEVLVYDPEGLFFAIYFYDAGKKMYRVRKMFGA
jgi:hypothetical protein